MWRASRFLQSSALLVVLSKYPTVSFAPNQLPFVAVSPAAATLSSASSLNAFLLSPNRQVSSTFHRTSVVLMSNPSSTERKAGVASPEELKAFVDKAGDKIVVVDVRNPDAAVEPGDQKSLAVAGLPSESRPKAVHLIWDREAKSMPLPDVPKDTPMITHCGGGGRGQKAKDFLTENGFKNVLNGGGPKESDCWAEFGSL